MWSDKAKREAVAAALVLATTLGGWHLEAASASTRAETPGKKPAAVVTRIDPTDAAFAYGDLLDAVQYQLGFEPDARDADQLRAACDSLLEAKAPGDRLRQAAAPIVEFCRDGDESLAEEAADAYATYRDTAFDLAAS